MSINLTNQMDVLSQIFQGLKHRNADIRLKNAVELRRYVTTTVAEMSSDAAVTLWDDNINRRLFELLNSKENSERWGGLVAIENLIDIESEDMKRLLHKFFFYVKVLLPNSETSLMVAASKTIGRIADVGSSVPEAGLGQSFLDREVPIAIEAMQADKQEWSYAGVLILKELAKNSPIYFHSHVGLVFDKIGVPLKDKRLNVREGAAELLSACLDIVTQRERGTRSPYFAKVLQEAQNGLRNPQPEVIHGSLLTFKMLLIHGGMFMKESFYDSAEQILRFRAHSDPHVRKIVITLIPTLAAYDTQSFSEHLLHRSMAHLLSQVERPHANEQAIASMAFVAIGHTAVAVGSDMKPFLENIMKAVKSALQMRGKKNALSEEPIFQCVGMLASAVGPNLTKLLHDQLKLMFESGLSEPLRQALVAIARHIPPLLSAIQERLLEMLSQILSAQPYRALGAPSSYMSRSDVPALGKDLNQTQTQVNGKSPELITLALSTLGSFDFSGHTLNEFVRECALPYLEDDHADVRRAAALTCCRVFMKDPICYQSSSHSTEIISDVLDKLLAIGIADPDPKIRNAVLSSLHDRFDKHLAQAENVRSLFIALNDEVFENRVTAVPLIGRLAKHNPAYVMPSLRKALIQLLTELEYSSVTRNREECTRLLTLLVSATQRLIKPYALPMLRALLAKANDSNPTVAANILMCLGELASVAGEGAMPQVPELMKVIIALLGDPALVKRDAALHTLGQVCSATGYVIQPLVDYPQLLPLLRRILQTEIRPVKREVVKVLGIMGALDPYRQKTIRAEDSSSEKAVSAVNALPANANVVAASDDYYQSTVITALLAILGDVSLASYHHTVIEAIMSIFKTQGLKCVAFLPQIIPAFTAVASTSAARLQVYYLQQLSILVGIVKQHIRNHTEAILNLVIDLWDNTKGDNPRDTSARENTTLQLLLVSLLEALGKVLDAEFKPSLPKIIPMILRVFDGELNEKRSATQIKILDTLLTFGAIIEEFLHLVIPVIVRSYERQDASLTLRKKAIQTIDGLSRRVNLSDHASRIIHPLVRVLDTLDNELRMAVMDTLCALVIQLGADFAIFVPTINKSLLRNRISHPRYETLMSKLLNGERLPQETGILELLLTDSSKAPEVSAPAEATRMTVNQQHLKQAWDVSQISTREDWVEWMHRLSVEFMKESPSHALRACTSLVDVHAPLAKELFNAAFLSCWTDLYDQYQEDLVRSIELAITAPLAPSDLVRRLLSLAEFMEHEEKPLPIEHHTLGEYARRVNALAKALHYKELEYFTASTPTVVESLISINTKLQQHDAAWGTLITARETYDVSKHEEWYEKLGRWSEALAAYETKARLDPESAELQMGRMRCLHALGEWDQLSSVVDKCWPNATPEERREMAPMAAASAWSLTEWSAMEDYISIMRNDSPDRSFYRALLSVQQSQFDKALQHIAKARDLLEPELPDFTGGGYGRSYNIIVRAQMLSELEEIITYKQHADQPERQQTMRRTWMKRLQGCQPDVEVWQRILQVRCLVLCPETEPTMWIKFANLCRKSERMVLADKTINSLLNRDHQATSPKVVYTQLKYMWANGAKEDSIRFLRQFSTDLSRDLDSISGDERPAGASEEKIQEYSNLLARCYFKQAKWQTELREDWYTHDTEEILENYLYATRCDPTWHKAWHTWALANFEVASYLENNQPEHRSGDSIDDELALSVVQAIDGFFASISLRNDEALQDTLRVLTLWFKFGGHADVSNAMMGGFSKVEVDTWLDVIPQIIARIQAPNIQIRRNIQNLLIDVGKHHPQALIYPLTVALKSSSAARRNAAASIMDRMQEHSKTIVSQAKMVSRELIRIAILWHEMWHEGLEEASRLYFTEKNPEGMIAALKPLHDLVEAGPTTARETSFAQVFGAELHQARDACKRYRSYGDTAELDKAWDIYYAVFRKIEKQLPTLTTLDLQYVSPNLLKARDLALAVPGTYQSGRPIVKIASFAPKLNVMASKQRPRRVSLKGSDGRDYQYMLKGHEDMRQDERVMQLFGLVNTLLSEDTKSFKRRLHIQRCPVIPLAPNAGLMGWLLDSDTLHVLIRDYRNSRKVLLNIEHRLMLQMAPDYENLTLLQRIEVFEYALENTTGQDLYRVLWLKSNTSEHWLERRATYTRSLAVNSMVGYILGLGDRHPSNLLLERKTGKVVHIDFGDCFEVAMDREKFPEKVPFRLTRMLTHAMEVSGIEGSFRTTCEITMGVLRENKESLMAVLEAFVYDPLITWRLIQTDADARRPEDPDIGRNADLAQVTTHPQGLQRRFRADENDIFNETDGPQEVRSEKALAVYSRVQHKLTGRDFDPRVVLTVPEQVEKLILQATSIENLCQLFSGWCAFW